MADENTDPTQTPQVVEPKTPGAPASAAPASDPSATPQPDSKLNAPVVQPAPADSWKDDRIRKLSAQKGDLTERIAVLEQELQKAKGGATPPAATPPAQPLSNDDEINARAVAIARQNLFNERCNQTAQVGRSKFPDFNEKLGTLISRVDRTDPQEAQQYNTFLEAAIETGNGAEIIHQLGSKPEEFERIRHLSPMKMAIELAKMTPSQPAVEGKTGDDDLSTHLPKPITPVGSMGANGATGINPDDPERADMLTTAEWMRRREQQLDDGRPGRFRAVQGR